MNFKSHSANGIAFLQLVGRFDANETTRVTEWFDKITAQTPARIVVNLTEVNFVDSSALALLVKNMKRCRNNSGDLVLCGLQQPVRVIFELTRLDKAFTITADEDQAGRAFNG
jgi:anti-sigma B factor antagonist